MTSTTPSKAWLAVLHRRAHRAAGQAPTIDSVDDVAEFAATREAMSLLGISDEQQMQVPVCGHVPCRDGPQMFSILAGILHLGDIEVVQKSRRTGDDAKIPDEDTRLPVAARLLHIDPALLAKWLVNRKLQTGKEVFTKPQTVAAAIGARDALAKHIYAQLFQWLVDRINEVSPHRALAVD